MPQSKFMWIIGALAVVVVAGGLWLWSTMQQPSYLPLVASNPNAAVSPSPTNGGNSGAISAQNTSNATLGNDLSVVDGQMSGMNSDSAAIDQSMSDQPISQSY